MRSADLIPSLLDVLHQVLAGLDDDHNQYLVGANYYDRLDGPAPRRWWLALFWLHAATVRHLTLEPEALLLEVLLTPRRDTWTRIRVPLAEIYQVSYLRAYPDGTKTFQEEDGAQQLYYERARFRLPPLGPTAAKTPT